MSRDRRHSEAPAPFWGRRFRDHAALAWAPAKVNLFLEVTGHRDDGYHELETLMLAVDLYDMLELSRIDEPAIGLNCNDPSLGNDTNLVVKAAAALHARYSPEWGAVVRLTKKIPLQAGLGGGSSDAATTLLALNDLWEIHAPREELSEVAASIGSDVAFFLQPPAAWCTGRGETVEPAPLGQELDLVIVKPPHGCTTAAVYENLSLPDSPRSADAMRKAVHRGNASEIGRALHNRLEAPALKIQPEIADVLRALQAEKPAGVRMTGSGSACFAVCRDRREALRVAAGVREAAPADLAPEMVFVVKSWPTV